MGDKVIDSIIVIMTSIVGLATVAVILSQKSSTASVLTSAGTAFSNAIKAAVSPVG